MSHLCASLTLEEAAETFSRLLPLQMSARQALNLLQPLGEALQQQEDEQVRALWEQAIQARTTGLAGSTSQLDRIDRLYIELDGVLARLRRGSVPMEEQERKRTGDVYREVKVGAVFEATRGPERSGLAPGVFVDQAGPKHYVARRGKAEDFGKLLYALAVKYGLQRVHQLVVLGDGAAWIWRLVAEHFPGAVQIVDIWHAREHVWKVARGVFGPNTPEASAWAEHACSLLVEGKIEDLVEEIVVLPPVPPEPGTSRSVPEIERDYFISNAARMRYPAFRAQGMHVGSGIAEAACKTVVSTRAKRTGIEPLRAIDAQLIVADALDRSAVMQALKQAKPEVVIHQLTALTGVKNYKKFDDEFALTNRLRTEGTDYLLEAAMASGARRFIAQSYGNWNYARTGTGLKTEEDPLDPTPPRNQQKSFQAIRYLEHAVGSAHGIEGVALRYGNLYGPGTGFAADGEIVATVRKRGFPIVGDGAGVWSFIHVDDAASAAVAAI